MARGPGGSAAPSLLDSQGMFAGWPGPTSHPWCSLGLGLRRCNLRDRLLENAKTRVTALQWFHKFIIHKTLSNFTATHFHFLKNYKTSLAVTGALKSVNNTYISYIKILVIKYCEMALKSLFSLSFEFNLKLDGVGPVDNRPSTDYLHHFIIFIS